MKKLIFAIFLIIIIFIGCSITITPTYNSLDISQAIDSAKATLKDNQEIVIFDSKNPFNFYDVLFKIDKISDQHVFGILTKPNNIDTFPVIIGVAGSKGWGEHHYGYLDRYLELGFATFSLHSFKSRKVESTVGEQLSVTIPMVVYDAFMALKKLADYSTIDINRAGIIGWSLGGGVALFSAWIPIQESISPDYKFAAHLPFYPPCMIIPDELQFTKAPVHILAGELDDWVPSSACEELVDAAHVAGFEIGITVYPESSHSFDRSSEVVLNNDAYSFTDCRMKIADDGVVRLKNGFPLSSPTLQKIGLFFCADKGAHWGGNNFAREHSKEFAKNFMRQHLLKLNK